MKRWALLISPLCFYYHTIRGYDQGLSPRVLRLQAPVRGLLSLVIIKSHTLALYCFFPLALPFILAIADMWGQAYQKISQSQPLSRGDSLPFLLEWADSSNMRYL